MQCNITTSLVVSLSENGFGLDELIYRMEDLANKKAFPELLKTILREESETRHSGAL